MSRLADVVRFYEVLAELRRKVGERRLCDCDGRMAWPPRGVYFFFEVSEGRSTSDAGLRVVRVGTHALNAQSSTTLWGRVSRHRGVASTGGGNHRGSIFRLLVGEALLRRQGADCASWGNKQSLGAAAESAGTTREAIRCQEAEVERRVSQFIGAMPFTWLRVDDPPGPESERGFIERSSIALLSNVGKEPIDSPSAEWLGRHSGREPVRASGLWNNNHVEGLPAPSFLDRFTLAVKSCTAP